MCEEEEEEGMDSRGYVNETRRRYGRKEEEGLFKAKAVNEVDDDVTPRRRLDPPTNRRRRHHQMTGARIDKMFVFERMFQR